MYTKWPTLYGDGRPPGITFCHTNVCMHNCRPGEVGENMRIIYDGLQNKFLRENYINGLLRVYLSGQRVFVVYNQATIRNTLRSASIPCPSIRTMLTTHTVCNYHRP
ncbi:hypothetical protein ASPBRDRAFT_232430 [Aspergillus brasiliensis CBS 101740]|uniref:Uncharacterized protein n=1 Tax=Aspergillus brasiliensis (strain CBS 101740 / IMI 381727 / IBT 21946) TaxID=767769 RepID=A0A1L9V017_ASPBC|nr:hypothetical protein ASPBRDRAFT_232430 [Aspergillus brasiliensis CBS 101740]